ncbi:hypothetical protein C8J56DRAFT_888819 [Mycena floridula]|nr:hypothetical protein C8J56DRAFT_888819 [Mycena floridula]
MCATLGYGSYSVLALMKIYVLMHRRGIRKTIARHLLLGFVITMSWQPRSAFSHMQKCSIGSTKLQYPVRGRSRAAKGAKVIRFKVVSRLTFAADVQRPSSHQKYYAHLRLAIAAARPDELGNKFTAWIDAVGKEEMAEGWGGGGGGGMTDVVEMRLSTSSACQ